MSNFAPNSELILYECPLEYHNGHTFFFANLAAQTAYFDSLTRKVVINEFNYIREGGYITIERTYEKTFGYNYLSFTNLNFNTENNTHKRFYAFINKCEYVNENACRIYFKIDVMQTWQFEINYDKYCFIQRETAAHDDIGENTVPENLEKGDYIVQSCSDYTLIFHDTKYFVQVTTRPNGQPFNQVVKFNGDMVDLSTTKLGKTCSVGAFWVFDTMEEVQAKIKEYDAAGRGKAVINVYIVPDIFIEDNAINGEHLFTGQSLPAATRVFCDEFTFLGGWDNYHVRNNKLFTYPYCYFLMSNNNGATNIIQPELLNQIPSYEGDYGPHALEVMILGLPTCGGSGVFIPENYNLATQEPQSGASPDIPNYYKHYLNALPCGKWPVCGWMNDPYTNWLTQNSINLAYAPIKNALRGVSGAAGAIGGVVNAVKNFDIFGGVSAIAQGIESNLDGPAALAQEYQTHELMPPTASGNTNLGDVSTSADLNSLIVYKMSIKNEYVKKIDMFFEMFGYAVNAVKKPNLRSRHFHNYLKTSGCYFDGTLPQDDMEEIRRIFDAGITLWHVPSAYLHYDNINAIV